MYTTSRAPTTYKGPYHPLQYTKKHCLFDILPLSSCGAVGIKPGKEKDIRSLFHLLHKSSQKRYENVRYTVMKYSYRRW